MRDFEFYLRKIAVPLENRILEDLQSKRLKSEEEALNTILEEIEDQEEAENILSNVLEKMENE